MRLGAKPFDDQLDVLAAEQGYDRDWLDNFTMIARMSNRMSAAYKPGALGTRVGTRVLVQAATSKGTR